MDELLRQANAHGVPLTPALLEQIVAENDKQRFAFNVDATRLRAVQGHSIKIDLGLESVTPPGLLYHGTVSRFLPSIRNQGLLSGRRDYVHLSPDEVSAWKAGARHGQPVILQVRAGQMHADGFEFWRAQNGVWLTRYVPGAYLIFPDSLD